MASCAHVPPPKFQDSDLRRPMAAWFPGAYDLRALSWTHVRVWGAAGRGWHTPSWLGIVRFARSSYVNRALFGISTSAVSCGRLAGGACLACPIMGAYARLKSSWQLPHDTAEVDIPNKARFARFTWEERVKRALPGEAGVWQPRLAAPQTRTCAHDRAHRSYAPGNQAAIGRRRSLS